MSRKIPSKDEALEALDFIVNVLKEHEKDLDRLINELGNVTEKMGDTGELTGKVEKVEERLTTLQNEIANLITQISSSPREQPTVAPSMPVQMAVEAQSRGRASQRKRGSWPSCDTSMQGMGRFSERCDAGSDAVFHVPRSGEDLPSRCG